MKNKILIIITLFSIFITNSSTEAVANVPSLKNTFLSPALTERDRELLGYSKNMLSYLDKKIWMLGMDEYPVEGPKKFIEAKRGLYYTGRLRVVRWGANHNVPIETYAWNVDQGERWYVTREVIYFDDEIYSYITAFQGPLALDEYRQANPRSQILWGEEPDWDSFD